MARRTKLTPALQQAIVTAIVGGVLYYQACLMADILPASLWTRYGIIRLLQRILSSAVNREQDTHHPPNGVGTWLPIILSYLLTSTAYASKQRGNGCAASRGKPPYDNPFQVPVLKRRYFASGVRYVLHNVSPEIAQPARRRRYPSHDARGYYYFKGQSPGWQWG